MLQVSNDSTAEFSKVVLTLRRRVKLMAERDPYYTRSCSYNSGNYQKVDATVAEQSYPGKHVNSVVRSCGDGHMQAYRRTATKACHTYGQPHM